MPQTNDEHAVEQEYVSDESFLKTDIGDFI